MNSIMDNTLNSTTDDTRPAIPSGSARFTHQVRQDLRDKGYSYQTEKTYLHWVKRYIAFHNMQHPQRLGEEQINQFLSHLGNQPNCSAATQRTALNALIYLYRQYLQTELGELDFEKARPRFRLPMILGHKFSHTFGHQTAHQTAHQISHQDARYQAHGS